MCIRSDTEIKLKYSANRIRKGYKVFSVKNEKRMVRSPFMSTEFQPTGRWIKAKDNIGHVNGIKPEDIGWHICPTIKEAMYIARKINHRKSHGRYLCIHKVYYKNVVSAGYWSTTKQINIVASYIKIMKRVKDV